jgi:hypothetical protein
MRNSASREDVSGTPQVTRMKILRYGRSFSFETELLYTLRSTDVEFEGDQGEDPNDEPRANISRCKPAGEVGRLPRLRLD